jgi:hypothetical protein
MARGYTSRRFLNIGTSKILKVFRYLSTLPTRESSGVSPSNTPFDDV